MENAIERRFIVSVAFTVSVRCEVSAHAIDTLGTESFYGVHYSVL